MQNKLFMVDDGADYWVVAPTGDAAVGLVKSLDDYDDAGEEPVAREVERGDDLAWSMKYRGEDGETCSMRLAFELCRGFPQIIACSEWP